MNEVNSDKTPYRSESRLWCQTERFKADVVNCITPGDSASLQQLEIHIAVMLQQYITGKSGRLFCDEISDAGKRLLHAPQHLLCIIYILLAVKSIHCYKYRRIKPG